jgi:hypothetical protein
MLTLATVDAAPLLLEELLPVALGLVMPPEVVLPPLELLLLLEEPLTVPDLTGCPAALQLELNSTIGEM